jgi:acyl-CoA thioester hydrolase
MAFFAEHGFPPSEFRRLALGPVIQKDELEYFREVGLHDPVTVTYAALAMSADGARFVIENEIWSAAGERAAVVRSTGGWLIQVGAEARAPAARRVFQLVPARRVCRTASCPRRPGGGGEIPRRAGATPDWR